MSTTEAGQSAWARSLTEDRNFEFEQSRLGHVWTLLGTTQDVARDGDWFRATLGGRSVLVQRFGDALKGFENRCAHRFYPLRTTDKGNGPLICGFHHWRYNQNGEAIGIPICADVFGVTPRELGAKLTPVEVATCGAFVFGRFPKPGTTESLEQFLGEGFPIVDALCTAAGDLHSVEHVVDANWKLMVEITLDDYHIVAVHNRPHYHNTADVHYFRFGLHSAHFVGGAETLAAMAALCREDRYRPHSYRIFNVFPNVAISLFAAFPYWYSYVQQFVPVAPGRSALRGWYFRTKFAPDRDPVWNRWSPFAEPIRARMIRYYIERTGWEDHRACEKLQTTAHQVDRAPILSSQEQRIAWFEEAYWQAVGADVG